MRGTVLFVAILLLVGWATALASGAARTWDFEGDVIQAPPAGFSFGRTGGGRWTKADSVTHFDALTATPF